MGIIKCCRGCVAPKRHPGCHDHCPEYLAEKGDWEARKAEMDAKKRTEQELNSQRATGVYIARKRRKV